MNVNPSEEDLKFTKSYADFGLKRSLWQVRYALKERKNSLANMSILLGLLRQNECLIEAKLGKPIKNLQILEIGPGQGLERARYFGLRNDVDALDLDVIPASPGARVYLDMIRRNGYGRFAKTVGRRLLIGRANEASWAKVVGVKQFRDPHMINGDICQDTPQLEGYDLVVSWSVFEHLPNPGQGLANVIRTLKPGGVFFISLHLFTSISGSHDIRSFTGQEDKLPLWGHLRQSTQHLITPSSYLNQWRLPQWRNLFFEMTPGVEEHLESYDNFEKYNPLLTNQLRDELRNYTDEELFTVDALYLWQKPETRDPLEHG